MCFGNCDAKITAFAGQQLQLASMRGCIFRTGLLIFLYTSFWLTKTLREEYPTGDRRLEGRCAGRDRDARRNYRRWVPHCLLSMPRCIYVNVNGTRWHPACLYLATVGGIAVMDTYHRHNWDRAMNNEAPGPHRIQRVSVILRGPPPHWSSSKCLLSWRINRNEDLSRFRSGNSREFGLLKCPERGRGREFWNDPWDPRWQTVNLLKSEPVNRE